MNPPVIAVLGASGLIGADTADRLLQGGLAVVPVARRFTAAQRAASGPSAITARVVDMDEAALVRLLDEMRADIVVNCIGVLQDGARGRAEDVHAGFVARLVGAIARTGRPILLVHLSVPGHAEDDRTAFSRTKREAERVIADASGPYAILRPGFVIGPSAYGGSALIRALAALPVALPEPEVSRPFAVTDIADIARTVAVLGDRWAQGDRDLRVTWDLMEPQASGVGDVIRTFRERFGGPQARATLPSFLLALGARAGDGAARLGWSPPIRSTALAEMRRGVDGDPGLWIAATGLKPASCDAIVRALPAGVQERWFARLYLAKALILASLVVFWILSGAIALTVAFDAATAILTAHGFPLGVAKAITAVSSLMDIAVGYAIAWRRTCRSGLLAGLAVSIFYMVGAAFMTPDLWIEPLGALVKTGPALVLMLVALATLEDRG